jgi:RHH-type rel operon transcriptional repressor/antitoxin RelB
MAISVRMDPLLEQELATAARRQGVTKSQFIIDAVERALGRKNPFELMQRLQAEESQAGYALGEAFKDLERPYDTDTSRQRLLDQLQDKHGAGSAG